MTTTIGSLDLASLKNLRDDVTQYFWFESNSSSAWGSGAHVTLYPESQFTDSTSPNYMKGQNIIMNTDGFSIRNGALPMMVLDNDSLDFNVVDTTAGTYTNVASFGASSTIGVIDGTQSYMALDYHSIQMIDREGNTYLHVSDLRNALGYIETIFEGDGSTFQFIVNDSIQNANSVTSVTVNDVDATYSITEFSPGLMGHFTLRLQDSIPPDGSIIKITYLPYYNTQEKAYTLGLRDVAPVGRLSVVEGLNNIATGLASHAEGSNTKATSVYAHSEGVGTKAYTMGAHAEGYYTRVGNEGSFSGGYSHAEGYESVTTGSSAHAEGRETTASGEYSHSQNFGTVAQRKSQTVLGEYNIADTGGTDEDTRGDYAVIIGNGTSDTARSNALTVDWDGNVKSAGALTMENHKDPIGWFYPISNTISKATGTSFASISGSAYTPSAGRYLITASARYSGASSGNRGVCIYQGGSVVDSTQVLVPAIQSSSWSTDLKTIGYFNVDGSTEFRIGLLQNSGSSLSTSYTLTFIRIR